MLDGRKIAFINDFGIDFEKEHRGERAFEMHGGIILMVLGDTELHGSHNIALKSRSESRTRGGFMAEILALPLGLEVERVKDFDDYNKYMRDADVYSIMSLLDVGSETPTSSHDAQMYLNEYIKGVKAERVGHCTSELSDLVRAIQTNRHIFIKIPEALISEDKEVAGRSFMRKLVKYQLANIVRAFSLNQDRKGGLVYDEALVPLMDFADVHKLNIEMPAKMDVLFSDYDLTEEEYEAQCEEDEKSLQALKRN